MKYFCVFAMFFASFPGAFGASATMEDSIRHSALLVREANIKAPDSLTADAMKKLAKMTYPDIGASENSMVFMGLGGIGALTGAVMSAAYKKSVKWGRTLGDHMPEVPALVLNSKAGSLKRS